MTLLNCDLSFDPADPYFLLPGGGGASWAVQVFTTENGYGLDAIRSPALLSGTDMVGGVFGYARLGQQVTIDAGSAGVSVERDGDSWTFHIAAEHREKIKAIKLILRGLPEEQLAHGWWSPTSPRDTTTAPPLQWNYPGPEWATRWAAAGSIAVSIASDQVSGAVLHVGKPSYAPGTEVEIVHAVPASEWSTQVTVPPIRVALGQSEHDVRQDLDRHLASVREGFGIPTWAGRADVPSWGRTLDLVVTLHGQHWTGHTFHTFDQMGGILQKVAADFDARRVLVYMPGWEGRYYYDYPHYRPSPELGGDAGFARLVEQAHQSGFRLMPMFGANGANVSKYPDWESSAIRNPSNRYPVMLNSPDWDGDRHPEGDQVFLNPGEPRYQAHLIDAVSHIVQKFGVDAAFFDTASFWFDDPRHPLYDGYRAITAELRSRHPELLLVAEGWWDAMTALFPMSQQWLGVERDIAAPELLTYSARTTSHLAEGTPGSGSTGVHEEGFRDFRAPREITGHLPVVSFAGGPGDDQMAEIRRLAAGAVRRSA